MSEETTRMQAQKVVDEQKRWLVEQGDEIGRQAKDNGDWKSQIRTIWEAARTETEPQVLLNLLRYQVARNDNWRSPQDVFQPLRKAIDKCVEETAGDPAVAMTLIRHLLAYTYRSYTYYEKGWKEESEEVS